MPLSHFCLLRGLAAGFASCSTARAGLLLARPTPGLGLGAGRTASRGVSSAATAARSAGLACSQPFIFRALGYRATYASTSNGQHSAWGWSCRSSKLYWVNPYIPHLIGLASCRSTARCLEILPWSQQGHVAHHSMHVKCSHKPHGWPSSCTQTDDRHMEALPSARQAAVAAASSAASPQSSGRPRRCAELPARAKAQTAHNLRQVLAAAVRGHSG